MSAATNDPVVPPSTPLRLMAVHAHPDDESSKGAATMARYVREGVEVMVATLTGGERGDILNKAMERPEVRENLPRIRREEMARAREILGVSQEFLGFIDSGLPEGDPLPPLPEGCFALQPLEVAAEPLVRAVREFRPHVILTYDEEGGYPHPDHIKTHEVAVEAFEAAADPDRYPGTGDPWQPLKLYYFATFHKDRITALHEELLGRGLESPYADWFERWEERAADRKPVEITTRVHVRRLLPRPGSGAAGPRHPDRPGELVVRLPGGGAARGLADRGLPSSQVGSGHRIPRGRPVRRGAGEGEPVSVLASSSTASQVYPGLIGFLVVAGMGLALYLLVPLDEQATAQDRAGPAVQCPARPGRPPRPGLAAYRAMQADRARAAATEPDQSDSTSP